MFRSSLPQYTSPIFLYSRSPHFTIHVFPKKLMILPCPGFPLNFLPFPTDDVTVDASVFCFGGGSSSEKDSQAGSSFVTRREYVNIDSPVYINEMLVQTKVTLLVFYGLFLHNFPSSSHAPPIQENRRFKRSLFL